MRGRQRSPTYSWMAHSWQSGGKWLSDGSSFGGPRTEWVTSGVSVCCNVRSRRRSMVCRCSLAIPCSSTCMWYCASEEYSGVWVCGRCVLCVVGLDKWCVCYDCVGVVLVWCVGVRGLPGWIRSTSSIALGFLGSSCKVQIATDGPWADWG